MASNLPVELYIQVLNELPVQDTSTLTTIISLLSVNKATRAAALDNSSWEKLYRSRYTHCDESREAERQQRSNGDYYSMFVERYKTDRTALQLLDYIRTIHGNYREGLAIASQIVQDMSFDVWDALKLETQLTIPKVFRDPTAEDMEEEAAPHALPRSFWARSLLGAIGRTYAMQKWQRLNLPDHGETFDDVLAGFSAFQDCSPKEPIARLDALAAECRRDLDAQGIELDSHKPKYNPLAVAQAVGNFMRTAGFSVAKSQRTFTNPLNQFPCHFLGPGRSSTLPMSLVWVFSGICRRLGLQAEPTNTPGSVFCHITSSDPQHGDILFDICGVYEPVVFSTKDVQARLAEAGMSAHSARDAVFPAQLTAILRRAAHNILHVTRMGFAAPSFDADVRSRTDYAAEAAITAIVDSEPTLFRSAIRSMANALPRVPEQCPLDRWPVLVDTLLDPDEAESARGQHVSRPAPKRRREGMPQGFVGQAVHFDNGDLGCVVEWEDRAGEGANESHVVFYVLADTGIITCHPEDFSKMKPAHLTPERVRKLRRSLLCFDRAFEEAVIPREDGIGGRLVPSIELQAEHPDDLEYAARWTDAQLRDAEGTPAVRAA
ncbi:hypothetical protein FKP32DRAFT_1590259 [Trametes sanguinea]|nr:hypothetical protein FKP32DRAFT_1590259 [Trametes sanguinea]